MKSRLILSTLGLALAFVIGCQQASSTSTGGSNPITGNPANKKLTVTIKESQDLKQGETDKVLVTINRDNFNDEVKVSLSGLPKGIEAEKELPIKPSDNTATFTLKAAPDAALGSHPVEVTAEAPKMDKVTQKFQLHVKAK